MQAFNFAFKDTIKNLFPRYNPKSEFWKFFACNMASGDFQEFDASKTVHSKWWNEVGTKTAEPRSILNIRRPHERSLPLLA